MPAEHCAGTCNIDYQTVWIPSCNAGSGIRVFLAHGIQFSSCIIFRTAWKSHHVDGITHILIIHKREIIGEYDFNTVGSYPLQYKVTDSSGNVESVDFILNVKAKSSGSSSNVSSINFNDVISAHKNDGTKIGIDVSKWQGNIDFEKLKNSGVEFIIIRVGTGLGFGVESIEDPNFKQNIEGAKKAGIPVGVYYYSYATSVKEAIRQANFVIDLVKDYKLDLPIVFDWESWSYFNSLNLSIHDINEVANAFLSEVEKAGYKGMLYGSKYYLQWIWDTDYPVWLAHYTNQTDYENEYDIWQLCDTGRVAGIITIYDEENSVQIEFYHCKYSKEKTPGKRVSDLYEVCGQCQKSIKWKSDLKKMIDRMLARESKALEKGYSRIELGSKES